MATQDPSSLYPRVPGSILRTAISAVVVEKFVAPETDGSEDATQAPMLDACLVAGDFVPATRVDAADEREESVGA